MYQTLGKPYTAVLLYIYTQYVRDLKRHYDSLSFYILYTHTHTQYRLERSDYLIKKNPYTDLVERVYIIIQ